MWCASRFDGPMLVGLDRAPALFNSFRHQYLWIIPFLRLVPNEEIRRAITRRLEIDQMSGSYKQRECCEPISPAGRASPPGHHRVDLTNLISQSCSLCSNAFHAAGTTLANQLSVLQFFLGQFDVTPQAVDSERVIFYAFLALSGRFSNKQLSAKGQISVAHYRLTAESDNFWSCTWPGLREPSLIQGDRVSCKTSLSTISTLVRPIVHGYRSKQRNSYFICMSI